MAEIPRPDLLDVETLICAYEETARLFYRGAAPRMSHVTTQLAALAAVATLTAQQIPAEPPAYLDFLRSEVEAVRGLTRAEMIARHRRAAGSNDA